MALTLFRGQPYWGYENVCQSFAEGKFNNSRIVRGGLCRNAQYSIAKSAFAILISPQDWVEAHTRHKLKVCKEFEPLRLSFIAMDVLIEVLISNITSTWLCNVSTSQGRTWIQIEKCTEDNGLLLHLSKLEQQNAIVNRNMFFANKEDCFAISLFFVCLFRLSWFWKVYLFTLLLN